jgi:hypothetical protein
MMATLSGELYIFHLAATKLLPNTWRNDLSEVLIDLSHSSSRASQSLHLLLTEKLRVTERRRHSRSETPPTSHLFSSIGTSWVCLFSDAKPTFSRAKSGGGSRYHN